MINNLMTTTPNALTVFENSEFGSIRTILINDESWFVGKDVAEALGYSNPRDALSKHVDTEDKGVANCDTLGGYQKAIRDHVDEEDKTVNDSFTQVRTTETVLLNAIKRGVANRDGR